MEAVSEIKSQPRPLELVFHRESVRSVLKSLIERRLTQLNGGEREGDCLTEVSGKGIV